MLDSTSEMTLTSVTIGTPSGSDTVAPVNGKSQYKPQTAMRFGDTLTTNHSSRMPTYLFLSSWYTEQIYCVTRAKGWVPGVMLECLLLSRCSQFDDCRTSQSQFVYPYLNNFSSRDFLISLRE